MVEGMWAEKEPVLTLARSGIPYAEMYPFPPECFVSCVTAEVAFPSTSCTSGLWGLSLCLGGYNLYRQGAFPGVGCAQLRKG